MIDKNSLTHTHTRKLEPVFVWKTQNKHDFSIYCTNFVETDLNACNEWSLLMLIIVNAAAIANTNSMILFCAPITHWLDEQWKWMKWIVLNRWNHRLYLSILCVKCGYIYSMGMPAYIYNAIFYNEEQKRVRTRSNNKNY